ncbi:tRNA-dihydrouridine synthase [Alkalibaculum bacchi]|uniref:tRNA dihydrouridine synthase n=1 Tax=Alkalibaculum bacchi TaxID=645887 RepID=UPI0026E9C9C4|nr:tRNA-dihydrouridine synthase family protein [Alkalibaculum bacchi]
MNFYFAPMEGLTGYVYRNAHKAYFNHIDKYFSPFIIANQSARLKTKELNDIIPENNKDIVLVPQLLTNNANDFIHMTKKIQTFAYDEVNLNLGCPSGTVVSKGRGAGFLSKPKELDTFLEEIFTHLSIKISIKTRIGKDSPHEFYELIEIYNKYPLEELIIHPRIQLDFYKNKPNLAIFKDALTLSKNPVCYNGDLFAAKEYEAFCSDFPDINTVMIGRGLIYNPGLAMGIKTNTKLDKNLLKDFHHRLYEDYQNILFGDKNVLFKMKEVWYYMIESFTNHSKYAKKIKKAQRLTDYDEVITSLFAEQEISEDR